MKKAIRTFLVLLLCVGVMLSDALKVQAATTVIYGGSGQKFSMDSDLFSDFKDVMPGDRLTQNLTLKNSSANDVDVKIYLRALGAEEGSEEFLSQLTLTVMYNGKTQIFNGPASQTAQLKDWVYLGTFQSGGSAELEVTLEIPIEMDNTYRDAVGTLQWEFKAEEIPVPTEKPTDGSGGSGDSGNTGVSKPSNPSVPATGDKAPIGLMSVLLTGSLLALGFLLGRKNLFFAR